MRASYQAHAALQTRRDIRWRTRRNRVPPFTQGYAINGKRVRRLMRQMGIQAVMLRKRPATSTPGHHVYPYLLRDRVIDAPNQVWCAEITYVPMPKGFLYLVAIMDWFSRYVITWEVSNSLEGSFCGTALDRALQHGTPTIFNTDQGSQFTAQAFTTRLVAAGVQISMDGKGRALDNIFTERLWRSVKYEEVYLADYGNPREARVGLGRSLQFYNTERPHQALAYRRPAERYLSSATKGSDRFFERGGAQRPRPGPLRPSPPCVGCQAFEHGVGRHHTENWLKDCA